MAVDEQFGNVSALLPLNGDFTDLAGKTFTAENGAGFSDEQSKFYDESFYLAARNHTASTPNHADFAFFSQSQNTIECWVYIDGSVAYETHLCGSRVADGGTSSGQAGWWFSINTDRRLRFYTLDELDAYGSSGQIPVDQWVHVVMEKDTTNLYFYIGGSPSGNSAGVTGTNSTGDFHVGSVDVFLGGTGIYIADFRYTRNHRRYAGAYTPPTEPFPTDGSVSAIAAVRSLLGPARAVFSNAIAEVVDFDNASRFVMVITGETPLELSISSWQATLQVDRQNYVQCVVPAVGGNVDEIVARQGADAEFAIFRESATGERTELARAPLSLVSLAEGPTRHSATLSGYSEAFSSGAPGVRTLAGPRQRFSDTNGNKRVRCSIDWLLRPGQTANDDGDEFEVAYINYYAPAQGDFYMDVGAR